MHVNHASRALLKIQYGHASNKGILCPVFYSFSVSMVQMRISEAQRWQIIGMHTTGMSFKAIRRQMGYHYAVVSDWGENTHKPTMWKTCQDPADRG